MRRPFVRILMAFLIGLWSPMCCCHAAWMTGQPCGAEVTRDADGAARADDCCGRPVEPGSESPPESSTPTCEQCSACQGNSPSFGALQSAQVKIKPVALDALSTFVLGVVLATENNAALASPPGPVEGRVPPATTRAGRTLLRWHCALIV